MQNGDDSDSTSPGAALSRSLGEGVDLVADIGDFTLDKLVSGGALDGVPVFGFILGSIRAVGEVRNHLYLRSITKFLQALDITSKEDRINFVKKLEDEGKMDSFGETILLVLQHLDDASKPAIVGRAIAAHIAGDLPSYAKAMRLVAIISRAYAQDFDYLASFSPGVPKDHDVAASLSSVGLLTNTGIDGGDAEGNGGYIYELNEYGNLLISHGLK